MAKSCFTLVVAALIAVTSFLAAGNTSAATVTVVMTGLDNPRGLTLRENGTLYVAEAGRGGSGPCAFIRGEVQCYGPSGAISRLRHGVQTRIVTGLPSYAPSSGRGATGPHDVSVRDGNKIYATVGLGGNPPAMRALFGPDFGWLMRIDEQHHTWTRFADISGYEVAANPDHGAVDSNPYGLLGGAGGRIVVDAGGNSLLRVSGDGANISTIATFPSRAQGRFTDAVPTSVTVGPDGAYYVGELTGVPFVPGSSRVYRVVPGQDPQVFLEGFSFILDLAFGPDDNLYVLEHSSAPFPIGPGSLIRVAPDGTRTVIATGLVNPTSVVIAEKSGEHDDESDDDGELTFYVSNCGTCAGTGEVIRIRP